MAAKPSFLVIGGGFAGITLAKALHKDANVTLIDSKDYFEINFATPRAFVEHALADQLVLQYKDIPNIGTFVRGTVVELDRSKAKLSDGQEISFDYAAICTGSSYANSMSKGTVQSASDRLNELKDTQAKIQAASSILVVGGGATGIEVAGELLTEHPGKQVTLVHCGAQLLPGLKPRLQRFALKWLQDKGAQVLLNEKVQAVEGSSDQLRSSSGAALPSELVFWCTGIKVNSGFMQPALGECVDAQGRVKVDAHLRVVGADNLFALGDVTDVEESKLAFLAGKHAELVASNFRALAKAGAGGKAPKLGVWKPNMGLSTALVTLGRHSGVMQVGFLSFTGWVPKKVKSANVGTFVQMWRQQAMA